MLALVMVLSVLFAFPAEATSSKGYKKAYRNFLTTVLTKGKKEKTPAYEVKKGISKYVYRYTKKENGKNRDYGICMFCLYNVDGKGAPELITMDRIYGEMGGDMILNVYTYKNGKMKEMIESEVQLLSNKVRFSKKGEGLYHENRDWMTKKLETACYIIRGTALNRKYTRYARAFTDYSEDEESGKIRYSVLKKAGYAKNAKKCTKKAFQQYCKKYFSSKRLETVKLRALTKKNIKKYIE